MTTKLPNGHRKYQMNVKYTNIFHPSALQNIPNWDFWYEKIPSGNPAKQQCQDYCIVTETLAMTGLSEFPLREKSIVFVFAPIASKPTKSIYSDFSMQIC
jgi:hypothetical protein